LEESTTISAEVHQNYGVRVMRHLSLKYFRYKLIEHFDIGTLSATASTSGPETLGVFPEDLPYSAVPCCNKTIN
jgi:hypothetical protein